MLLQVNTRFLAIALLMYTVMILDGPGVAFAIGPEVGHNEGLDH